MNEELIRKMKPAEEPDVEIRMKWSEWEQLVAKLDEAVISAEVFAKETGFCVDLLRAKMGREAVEVLNGFTR